MVISTKVSPYNCFGGFRVCGEPASTNAQGVYSLVFTEGARAGRVGQARPTCRFNLVGGSLQDTCSDA